jgi:hypothetical protein
MPLTMRELLAQPLIGRTASVLALGALLGVASPFAGDPPLAAPIRIAFWIGMVCLGYAAAAAANRLVPAKLAAQPVLRGAATAITSALPLTFVAAWVIPLIRPGHIYEPLELPALLGAVFIVQLAIVFILLRDRGQPAQPAPPLSEDERAVFPQTLMARLPNRLGGQIVALEAEDHYLRVHTSRGSDLVLMRLSDAVAAIAPELGFQVHRSWWVADDAICEIIRSEQRTLLKLSNGLTVPVGRTFSAALRARPARRRPAE